jgi:ligand-binding sensor domain-containing protein
MIKILLIILILSSGFTYPQNQWRDFYFSTYIDGLAVDSISIWIATNNGLVRMNTTTYESMIFTSENSGLPNNEIRAVAVDKNGILWTAAFMGGLTKYNGWEWITYNTSNSGIPYNGVYAIGLNKDDVWLANMGITKFDGTNWTNYNNSNSDFPAEGCQFITCDTGNVKWFIVYDGIVKYDDVNFTLYTEENSGLTSEYILCISFDDSNNAWIGTWGGGLVKYNGSDWIIYNSTNTGFPLDSVYSIAIDGEGNKWIGTYEGLVKYGNDGMVLYDTANSGIAMNWVRHIAIDSHGTKWIVTINDDWENYLSAFNENGLVPIQDDINKFSPKVFLLSQNYPNPFNPSTAINYQIPEESLVQIKVYDVMGREIKELVNEQKKAGFYRINFDGSNLSSGMYLYRIDAGKFSSVRKMLLVK